MLQRSPTTQFVLFSLIIGARFFFIVVRLFVFHEVLCYLFFLKELLINCSGTKFVAIIVNVLVFYANFSLDIFCAFLREHFLTPQMTFSFRSSFSIELYCSHSK